jgi:hypothetical protein
MDIRMRRILSKKLLGVITVVFLAFFIAFAFLAHPSVDKNAVKVEWRWYEPSLHRFGVWKSTVDIKATAQIAHEIRQARWAILPRKAPRVIAEVNLINSDGKEQHWTLFSDNTIAKWGASATYALESALVDTIRSLVQHDRDPLSRMGSETLTQDGLAPVLVPPAMRD